MNEDEVKWGPQQPRGSALISLFPRPGVPMTPPVAGVWKYWEMELVSSISYST